MIKIMTLENDILNSDDQDLKNILSELKDINPTPPKKSRKGFFNLSELSNLIDRNVSTISKQLKKAGLKPNKDGKYNIIKVQEIFQEAAKRDLRNGATDPTNPKALKTKLECEILQEKLNQLKGNLITKDEHLATLLQSHQIIKQQLINLPKEVAQRTSDREANEAVRKLIENLCNNVADMFSKLGKDIDEKIEDVEGVAVTEDVKEQEQLKQDDTNITK